MSTQTIIFAGVAFYMVVMIGVGLYASKKTHSTAEFIVAGRSLPLGLLTTTIIATWFGGAMMIGGAGAAYDEGFYGVVADPFGGALCLLLLGLFFVRLFRRLKLLTFVDFVEQRFGRTAAVVATIGSLMSNLFWVSSMLVAFAIVFESLTGVPMVYGILGGAAVVILYTTMGGMLAVALTDFVQMIIIIAGLFVLLAVVLIDAGGWGNIGPHLPEGTFRLTPPEGATREVWLNYARALVIIGVADIASQTLIGRALAAKSERVAQQAFYLGAIGYLVLGLMPVMIGIIASVTMPGVGNSESIVPTLAIEHLHPVILAVFVGAILAAIMSSADSALLAAGSVISANLLPIVVKDASERLRLRVARWSVPVCGIVAIAIALNAKVVYNTMLDANLLMLAAIIAPFILGVWWKKANRTGALAAMAGGVIAWQITATFFPNLPGDFVGLCVSLVTMLIVTPLTQTFDPPRELRDSDGNVVELTDRLGTLQ